MVEVQLLQVSGGFAIGEGPRDRITAFVANITTTPDILPSLKVLSSTKVSEVC